MIVYFDCFGGISGDMALGALLDAGGEGAILDATVAALRLGGEVRLRTRREERGHLSGVRVIVEVGEGPPRRFPELRAIVARAELPERVRERSLEALGRLADAEARIHGVPAADLHLHELGGADTLVDLVGAFWLLDSLGAGCGYSSALPAPEGAQAGMPLPAPAALEILAGTGATWRPALTTAETVTPTGAAILATATRFERPEMRVERVGYGIGARPEPGNAMRVWLGEPVRGVSDLVSVLESNLDDMAPDLIAALAEDLMEAGALDVTVTPVLMKKGRPGHLVSVLSPPDLAERIGELILRSSSTLGVRLTTASRMLAGRRLIEVATAFGRVRVKVKEMDGQVVDVSPEYEDCRRLSRERGVDLREVMRAGADAARKELSN
ncbi:MAG: nickel pincer cofactor biosynthesis protein LarC [Candidatus Dormibacteraceae bacterium]